MLRVAVALVVVACFVVPAGAVTPVYVDKNLGRDCAGLMPCFATIQAAVDAAGPPPAEVFVFPDDGTPYAESVDLSMMNASSPGDITISTVNAAGVPSAGTAAVEPAIGEAFMHSTSPFPGDIVLNGLDWTSADADGVDLNVIGAIEINDCVANGSLFDGADLTATTMVTVRRSRFDMNGNDGCEIVSLGPVLVEDSHADENGDGDTDDGFDIQATTTAEMSRSSANRNGGDGIQIYGVVEGDPGRGDRVLVSDVDVLLSDCDADGNLDGDGFRIGAAGDRTMGVIEVEMTRCGGDGNNQDGIGIWALGPVVIRDSHAHDSVGLNGIKVNSSNDIAHDVDVTIENCHAHRNGLDGIKAAGAGNRFGHVVVRRSSADSNGKDGFKAGIADSGGLLSLTAEDCSAVGNMQDGFSLWSTQSDTTTPIVIRRCRAERQGPIDEVDSGQHGYNTRANGPVTVEDSIARGNRDDGFNIVIVPDGNGAITMRNCQAIANGDPTGVPGDNDGFALKPNGAVIVRDSLSEGNAGDGFYVKAENGATGTSVTFENCRSIGNGTLDLNNGGPQSVGDGFDIGGGSSIDDVTIEDSIATRNADDGFDIVVNGAVVLTSVRAIGNGTEGFSDDGIDIDRSASITMRDVVSSNNVDDGMHTASTGNASIDGCVVSGNGDDGIDVQGLDGDLEIRRCCLQRNGGNGAVIESNVPSLTIESSDINANQAAGVCLEGGVSASATGNNISGNRDGLLITSGATLAAEANYWGASTGPTHTNNPTGTGDTVVDQFSGGGSGTINFAPFRRGTANNMTPCKITAQAPALTGKWLVTAALVLLALGKAFLRRRGSQPVD